MSKLYSDEALSIDEDGLTIFNYYFPLGAPKHIKLQSIVSVSLLPLTKLNGKYRAWGMGLKPYWFNMGYRDNKETALVIDTGKFIKSAVTPRSSDEVQRILTQLGITFKT